MNILITGASNGIGYQVAKKFALDTSNTILATGRSEANLVKLKEECLKQHAKANVISLPCDLSIDSNISMLTSEINKHIAHLDLLICNAGALVNKPFEEISKEELLNMVEVNFMSPFKLAQKLLPLLLKSKKAQIITIGSMGGINGSVKFPGLSAYSATKGALSILTECLAEEFKEKNIRVNCLAIGSVNTAMLRKAFPTYRAAHEATEMADFIVNFANIGSQFFNGKTIPVSSTTP